MSRFFPQLNSIYQSKPPVSRAKMASITKQALNAIKVNTRLVVHPAMYKY